MASQAHTIEELLESSDVARELDLSYSGVRVVVESGRLQPYAVTKRGVKLFKIDAVRRLKRERAASRKEARNR